MNVWTRVGVGYCVGVGYMSGRCRLNNSLVGVKQALVPVFVAFSSSPLQVPGLSSTNHNLDYSKKQEMLPTILFTTSLML